MRIGTTGSLLCLLIAVTLAGPFVPPSRAQATGAPPPAPRTTHAVAPEMTAFFAGKWACDGSFSTGRPISATMEFAEVAGGGWLSAVHDDLPPNGYHAFALWGVVPGGGIVGNLADNGGGMRRFVAADGWKDARLLLVRDTAINSVRFAERFVYARESGTTFRMTYETARDTATAWRMGDTLLCTKR